VNDGKNRSAVRELSFDALESRVKSGSVVLAVVQPLRNVVGKKCDDGDEEAAVVPKE